MRCLKMVRALVCTAPLLPATRSLLRSRPALVKIFNFTPGTDQFTGTIADDTFNATISGIGGGTATLSPLQFDFAHAGDGSDTINITVATGAGASLAAVTPLVTGVDNWHINETVGLITDAGGINASTLDSASLIEQIGQYVSVNHVGAEQTIAFNGGAATPAIPGTVGTTVSSGVHSVTVQLTDVGSGSVVRLLETTAGDLTTITVNGSVNDPGVLNINLLPGSVPRPSTWAFRATVSSIS